MRKIGFTIIGFVLLLELLLFINSASEFYSKESGLSEIGRAYEIELALGTLEKNMGYVGFIHHFKNYILRRDETYFQEALKSFYASQEAIEILDDILPNKNNNLHNLVVVEQVLNQYRQNLKMAKQDLNSLSYIDLDNLVKVNDKPAQKALNELFDFAHKNQKEHFENLIEAKRSIGLQALFHFSLLIFGGFGLAFYQKIKSQKILVASQSFFKDIIDKSMSPVFAFGEKAVVNYYNKKALSFAFENGQKISTDMPVTKLFDFFEIPEADVQQIQHNDFYSYSREFDTRIGDKKHSYEVSIKKFNSGLSGGLRGIISIYDRTQSVNLYQVSEVHHRVKNNLALLSSIMGIYRMQYSEEEALVEVIDSIDQKISSIASLYDNEQYLRFGGNSSFEKYLQHLTNVYNGFSPERYITLNTNLNDGLSMTDTRTIALGTIYMEFLTNLIKHSKATGDVELSFDIYDDPMGQRIEIKEHGGEPVDIKKISETKSLGNKLNKILALQEGYNLIYKWDEGLILSLVPFRDEEEAA